MELLRRGRAPTIKRGPYAGEKLTADHIIPRAVAPTLDKVFANLELMPHAFNIRKGARADRPRQQAISSRNLHAGRPPRHLRIASLAQQGRQNAVTRRKRAVLKTGCGRPAGQNSE